MARLGPVITLTAGAVLAAGLGVASINAAPAANTPPAGNAAQESAAAPSPSREEPEKTEPQRVEPKPTEKADYGGRVKGNGALIAVSIRNGKAVGYFCDGRAEAWFKGSESAGELNLRGVAGGGSKVTARLGGGQAKGSVSVGGKKWNFVASTVAKPSGLYRATALVRGAKLRAGWIVIKNPDGGYDQVGAAFAGEEQFDVPRLDNERPTSPVTVDDTTVYPKDVDGFIEEMQ
ncbi:hypothetical protein ACFOY2_33690 [Nonomuraea purpurea]|uniref:Serine/threonine protein kinase n=1 Tax=Nonomuraea purpurea TaxID=1849276 RepID=A0ABV8GE83_9ACTN